MGTGGLREVKKLLSGGFHYNNLQEMARHCREVVDKYIVVAFILGDVFDTLSQRVEQSPYEQTVEKTKEEFYQPIEQILDAALESLDEKTQMNLLAKLIQKVYC